MFYMGRVATCSCKINTNQTELGKSIKTAHPFSSNFNERVNSFIAASTWYLLKHCTEGNYYMKC